MVFKYIPLLLPKEEVLNDEELEAVPVISTLDNLFDPDIIDEAGSLEEDGVVTVTMTSGVTTLSEPVTAVV